MKNKLINYMLSFFGPPYGKIELNCHILYPQCQLPERLILKYLIA